MGTNMIDKIVTGLILLVTVIGCNSEKQTEAADEQNEVQLQKEIDSLKTIIINRDAEEKAASKKEEANNNKKYKYPVNRSLEDFDTGRIIFNEVYASFNGRNTDYRVIEMRVRFDGYEGTTVIQDSIVHLLTFDIDFMNVDLDNASTNNKYYYGEKIDLNRYGIMLYAEDGVTMEQQFYHDEFGDRFILEKYMNYKVKVPIINSDWVRFNNTIPKMEKFKIFIRGLDPGVFYREDIGVKK